MTQNSTEQFWKIAVADLHQLRFGPPSESEHPFQSLRQHQTMLQSGLNRIAAASRANVDQELVKMVEKHVAMDKEVLELLSQCQNEAAKIGISEDFSPTPEQIEAGWQLLADLQADPSHIERLPPELRNRSDYIRAFVRCFERLMEITTEQFHDIELMQARLQGRYALGKFALPAVEP